MQWYEAEKTNTERNPIILAAEFHYKFIRIHPFDDGNGRTARLLMNLILMRFDFPPAIIKTSDKENYYNVLRQADAGMLTPFIDYIAQNIIYSLEIMISAANGEDINDPNDLDKEIAILEQQLKAATTKDIPKEVERVKNIMYQDSVRKLNSEFINMNKKFDRLYSGRNYRYKLNGIERQDEFVIDEDIYRYVVKYNHEYLKYEGLEYVSHTSSIIINFNKQFYIVQNSNRKTSIQKNTTNNSQTKK